MKKQSITIICSVLLVAAASLFTFIGCESDPSTDVSDVPGFSNEDRTGGPDTLLSVTPENSTVSAVGDEVMLTVSGGSTPFSWDVANHAAGTITTMSNNRQARYRATQLIDNTIYVTDRDKKSGTANINGSGSTSVSIDPGGPITLPAGATAVLTAIGGVPPFTWTSLFPDLGTITPTSERQATYFAGPFTGTNSVNVVDQSGRSDSVTINVN